MLGLLPLTYYTSPLVEPIFVETWFDEELALCGTLRTGRSVLKATMGRWVGFTRPKIQFHMIHTNRGHLPGEWRY